MARSLTLCAMTVRKPTFQGRVAAAADAGFDSIGLSLEQYRDARRAGLGDPTMRALLADHGLRLAEVEAPWDWASDDPAERAVGDELFGVLDRLDCRQLNAVQFSPYPQAFAVERFRKLCARAAESDALIAVEFMPFSELSTLEDAWRLVRASEAANAGLILDHWHCYRTGVTRDTLAAVPASAVASVQLNDTRPVAEPDLREEARHRRELPGPQAVEFLRLLRALAIDYARMSAEIWSDELETLPPADAARRAFDATSAVLTAAGWPNTDVR